MPSLYKYLIIGGGAAGVSAAETIRSIDATGSMAIISDEPYLMYSRVMLSKPSFFLGKIPFDEIYLKGKEWYSDNHIDFLGGKKAASCDFQKKIVTLSDSSVLQYEKLLIATGVEARKWKVEGTENKKGIFGLRSLEDGLAIMKAIKTAKKGLTIGGGFISFEMADLLNLAKIETTMVIRESHFWEPTLDESSGQMIEKALTSSGIKIIKNAEVRAVQGIEKVEGATIKQNKPEEKEIQTPCDIIIAGIGVTNSTGWLKESGLKTNLGILANEYMETSAPDVWTAGDIAEYKDLLLEENVQMGNWVNAREQGRIAGLNMTGKHEAFRFVSFYTTSGCGINIALVGDVAPGPDRLVIPRGSPEINSYARLIVVGKELVGATLLNRSAEMTTISKLIEKNVDVSNHLKELGDSRFELKRLHLLN